MKKEHFILIVFLLIGLDIGAQNASKITKEIHTKPKLVVGIVVDQMRHDYLHRFWDRFGEDGFKKMINEGYIMKNAHYNYVPTITGPGHASVYTGTSPRFHGILSNNWYDKTIQETIYCAADDATKPIGTKSTSGQMSPHRMMVTTVTDQNRIATQFEGKTIGVALKDRAAILPAGHTANAAYWLYGADEGNFITSSYYMDELPKWVKEFNDSRKIDEYFKTWNTLHPIETYTESGNDLNDFEKGFKGKKTATFPYDIKELSKKQEGGQYELIFSTPFGNNILTDFALAAIDGEELGNDDITDFLTISYSSPDFIGHNFGVNSKEVQDNYLRLDQDIARLLEELDKKIGKDNYTVFLTADHAAVNVPSYLKSKGVPAGYFSPQELKKDLDKFMVEKFGDKDLVLNLSNQQIFLNHSLIDEKELDLTELTDKIEHFLISYPKIAQTYTRQKIEATSYTGLISRRIKNGFHPERSGDVLFELHPAHTIFATKGSNHSSGYKYDTHIPMIFYGKGINNGQSTKEVEIIDIAPTISSLLGIGFPSATYGKVLSEVID